MLAKIGTPLSVGSAIALLALAWLGSPAPAQAQPTQPGAKPATSRPEAQPRAGRQAKPRRLIAVRGERSAPAPLAAVGDKRPVQLAQTQRPDRDGPRAEARDGRVTAVATAAPVASVGALAATRQAAARPDPEGVQSARSRGAAASPTAASARASTESRALDAGASKRGGEGALAARPAGEQRIAARAAGTDATVARDDGAPTRRPDGRDGVRDSDLRATPEMLEPKAPR